MLANASPILIVPFFEINIKLQLFVSVAFKCWSNINVQHVIDEHVCCLTINLTLPYPLCNCCYYPYSVTKTNLKLYSAN